MAILLRTLTEKSYMNHGKFRGNRVRNILNLGISGKTSIVWYYYNSSMISFCDELLNELGITEELRIEKPGKESTKMYEWKDANMTEKDRLDSYHIKNKIVKSHNAHINRIDNSRFSASNLKNKNQGH